MCQSKWANRTILKYADYTVIISELQGKETSHGPIIDDFIKWCEESYLQLNLSKTKYMIIDFKKQAHPHEVTRVRKYNLCSLTNTLGLSLTPSLTLK